MAVIIHASQVQKAFVRGKQEVSVLNNLNLEIEEGSFVVLVGPSGCGKTTLLNIIAGLTSATDGAVYYRASALTRPHQNIGYLTQLNTLMPWRNVERNVEMPLEMRGVNKAERSSIAQKLIHSVGL